MAALVKQLKNNRKVIFDKGRIDEWCVYVVEHDGTRKAPFDEIYFSDLLKLSKKYPPDKVYKDFVTIYDKTTKNIDLPVLDLIERLTLTYHVEDRIAVEQWFTVLYAGMIAEENKDGAKLKKRIKRLGMHQVLMLDMPAKDAAKFSYGKNWQALDVIMKSLGF